MPETRTTPEIDVVIESPLWADAPEAEQVVRDAIGAAARRASRNAAELAVLLTDDAALRRLNRQWRDQDKPTNVLSFPAGAGGGAHLGDIAIAYETLAREAQAEGRPFAHHLAHLAIHGYLHLLGYDHMTDAQAATMETLETALLGALGIPDPHAVAGDALADAGGRD